MAKDYRIIVDTCPPAEAEIKFNSWISNNPEFYDHASAKDIIINHVLTEINGEKTCHRRYRANIAVLEKMGKI